MAALTSSAIAPLRVRAAAPAAGRKVRLLPCCRGSRPRARALALTAAPLCRRRRHTGRVRPRGHAQAAGVRPPGAGRRCYVRHAGGCPARVRRQHVRRQPHRCVPLRMRRVWGGAAAPFWGRLGGNAPVLLPQRNVVSLGPTPGLTPPCARSVRAGRHLHRGGQAHRRRRRRRLQRGQRCAIGPRLVSNNPKLGLERPNAADLGRVPARAPARPPARTPSSAARGFIRAFAHSLDALMLTPR